MAARVTLLVFCFLFLTNVLDASEETDRSLPTTSPQLQAAQTSTNPDIKATSTITTMLSSSSKIDNIEGRGTPETKMTTTVTTPSVASSGATSTIITTSQQSAHATTVTSNTTQSVHTPPPSTVGVVPKGYGQQATTNTVSTPKTSRSTEFQDNDISAATTKYNVKEIAGEGDSGNRSETPTEPKEFDPRYLWLLVLLVVVMAVGMYLKFKWCKVQHHPVETMDHGTENASFQRSESNKDGVMLLGVKSGGEENVAAK